MPWKFNSGLSESRIHSPRCSVFQLLWSVNSSPPSATYMCQWIASSLVQIMACRLFSAKPLPEPMMTYCQLEPSNKLQWNWDQNTKLFIHKNTFENFICEMAAILSRGRWVNMHLDSITAMTVTYQMSKWLEGHDMQTHSLEPLWHFTVTVCLTTWSGILCLEVPRNIIRSPSSIFQIGMRSSKMQMHHQSHRPQNVKDIYQWVSAKKMQTPLQTHQGYVFSCTNPSKCNFVLSTVPAGGLIWPYVTTSTATVINQVQFLFIYDTSYRANSSPPSAAYICQWIGQQWFR